MSELYNIINPNGQSYDWFLLVAPAIGMVGFFIGMLINNAIAEKAEKEDA